MVIDNKGMILFKHDLLPRTELISEMRDDGRYYNLPKTNQWVPSVTTVIGRTQNKSGLLEWQKKVGAIKAEKVRISSSRRGTAVHKIAEKYLLGMDHRAGAMPTHLFTFNQIKPWLDQNVDTVLGVELPLHSASYGVAGTMDFLFKHKNGELRVLDLKTSRYTKKDEWVQGYYLQGAIYAEMVKLQYGLIVPEFTVLIAYDDDFEGISRHPYQELNKRPSDYIGFWVDWQRGLISEPTNSRKLV